jgi:hypothetical protein
LNVAILISPSPSAAGSGVGGRVPANVTKASSLASVTGVRGWNRQTPNW